MTRARLLALALLLADPAGAQVALDGSLGPAGALLPDAAGDIEIPQAVGRLEGENLFHSFSQLDVARGQSATFTATDAGIARVLARVTGNTRSRIDGALRSHVPGADLYLFNPAGVIFGSDASLDVDGSLYVGSADALRLSDGGVLRADPAAGSILSSAPPSAWEFAGPAAQGIRIEGSRLEVNPRSALSLVGGPIEVRGRAGARFGEPVLVAPGGRIELAATAAAGLVALAPSGLDASGVGALGGVSLSENAQLTTAGARSGTLQIRARDVRIDNAFVFSDSLGSEAPLPLAIDIEARGDVVITGPAELVAELDGSADTGDVRIAARSLRMSGRDTLISSWLSEGSGSAGDVELALDELHMRDGAQLKVESNSPLGRGGQLRIDARRIDLAGLDTFAGAESRARGAQIGGSFDADRPVRIRADEISLTDGGQILSITRSAGDGADIEIEAGVLRSSGIASSAGRLQPAGIVSNEEMPEAASSGRTWRVGDLGSVRISVRETIDVSDGGAIQASSRVREEAADGREAGVISVEAPRITLRGSFVEVGGAGRSLQSTIGTIAWYRDAGDIDVRTTDLQVSDGASITATTEGPGRGGTVAVHAESARIAGKDARDQTSAGIFAQSLVSQNPQGTSSAIGGPGGDIQLSVGDLEVSDGGVIRVSSETAGAGGRLAINTGPGSDPRRAENASIRLSDAAIASKALSAHQTRGGTISIAGRELQLERSSQIAASNEGRGDAGNIEIDLGDALRISESEITTEARDGFGGNVTIQADRLLDMLDSRIATSVSGATGDGGNIEIDPRLVVLNRSSILATAVGGDGGSITLIAAELLSSADSAIDASSQLGVDGDVVIRSPAGELIEGVAPLQADLLGAADLLRRGCAAQRSPSGTLTVAPRVVRIGPDGVLEDGPGEAQEHCEEP